MVMKICHYNIKPTNSIPPEKDGWEQLPLGYYRMSKCVSPERKAYDEETYRNISEVGYMREGAFQQDCLLSILNEITRNELDIIELGAGWGRISLNLAGAVDFKLIPCKPEKYHCLAVEAEPVHYEWLKEHFEKQNINGKAIWGAVSRNSGTCRFDISTEPDFNYGQSIALLTSRKWIPNIHSIRNTLIRKTVKVDMYSLDDLIKRFGRGHVDIVQMDVQGAEYDVIYGAVDSIKNNVIDYFLINIHRDEYNRMLQEILSDKYSLEIDIHRLSQGIVEGFPPIQCHDGIQLYKRRNI